jgi:hypothetical protein
MDTVTRGRSHDARVESCDEGQSELASIEEDEVGMKVDGRMGIRAGTGNNHLSLSRWFPSCVVRCSSIMSSSSRDIPL